MRYLFVFLALIFLSYRSYDPIKKISISGAAQGTSYHITYYATDSFIAKKSIDSILNKIDSSVSLYKDYSLINRFNNSAGGIIIDDHFNKIIIRALQISRDTKGLFDITVQPLVQAWGFGATPASSEPDAATIRSLLKCVGSGRLSLKDNFLSKKKQCIRIDLNGIAQGYSVDVLSDFISSTGIKNYIVELGGEIIVKGRRQPENSNMKIGVESPGTGDPEMPMLQKILSIDSGAVTTSGSYRKFHESKGRKITHLIDPRTGRSIQNELISVTVHAPDAITADGFDNALMVMGLKRALSFVEKRNDISAYFIYRDASGKIKDTASRKFYRLISN